MPVLSNQERVGSVIGGRYEVRRLIGQGGMGAVFEALHRFTKRRVAVKILQPEYATDADATARFLQEAQAATAINHPNIVQVFDMGVDESQTVYLVLEFLEGEDLSSRLEQLTRLSPTEAFGFLLPVMNALALAHAKGIVHRDLKPANIFLARQEDGTTVPKLLDFGISKISSGEALARTSTGAILGTPYYMAPEQARGEKGVDRQVDIWAMGVVLYQCLSGRLPFMAENYNQMILKLVMDEAPRIETYVPSTPPAVAALVHRALTKDRALRFATMEQFITEVLAFLKTENTSQFRALSSLAMIESDPTLAQMPAVPETITRPAEAVAPHAASPSTGPGFSPFSPAPVPQTAPALANQPPTDLNWQQRADTRPASPAPRNRAGIIAAGLLALAAIAITVGVTATRHGETGAASRASAASASSVTAPTPANATTVQSPAPVVVPVPNVAVVPNVDPAANDAGAQSPTVANIATTPNAIAPNSGSLTATAPTPVAAQHSTTTTRPSTTRTTRTGSTPRGTASGSGTRPGGSLMMGWGEH